MTTARFRFAVIGLALATAACGSSSPVPRNAVDPPPNSVGDAPGAGLDVGSNAGQLEQERSAARPLPTDGLAWRWDDQVKSARFGVPPNGTSFSIACVNGRIVLGRFDAAPRDAVATMSFTGNGRVASLPAKSVGDPAKLSSLWQASEVPSDRTNAVARVFSGPAPIEITLADTTTLVTRPSDLPGKAFAACGQCASLRERALRSA